MVAVEEQQEIVVADGLAALVALLHGIAAQIDAETAREIVCPLFVVHLVAVGLEPVDVLDARAVDGAALEEVAAAEDRVFAAQRDDALHEGEEFPVVGGKIPVHPADLVVLAVGVVVAVLGAAHLVAGHQHWHALGEKQGRQQVALLLRAQGIDAGIIGRPLGAAVPGVVVVGAVTVVLAVGLVVLVVVAHQVVQGEAVVGGDEVHAGVGLAAAVIVEIAGAGETSRKIPDQAAVALPVRAHGVTIVVVPLAPARWEVAHLVAALAQIPGFGDEFDLGQHRILEQDVEEGAEAVDVVQFARQGRGQIETEAVDVHLQHPVAQRVHDELEYARLLQVEGVAAACVIHAVARIRRRPAGSRRHCRRP